MTPRFPRTEPLIPDELLAKLIENDRTSEEHDGFDPFPVVKLFTPDAGATWLLTEPETPYLKAAQAWDERIGSARVQAKNWRLMAFGSLALAGGFVATLVWQSTQGTVVPWVVQVDKFGEAQAVASAVSDYLPTDPQIAWHLGRFIEQVRSIPADPVIGRQNWLRAYDYTTDRGAIALNDYARGSDPFTKVGKRQVSVEISSVIRASPESFRVAWLERAYENGQLSGTERRTFRPTSSSTPICAPIIWSCARPRKPTWPRCRGSIRRISCSHCGGRAHKPHLCSRSQPASTSRS